MKKTILLCIMLMILTLSLFGCANKEASSSSQIDEATTSQSSGESSGESSTASEKKPSKKEKVPITLQQFAPIKKGTQIVSIETSMGVIKIALFANEAPQAVENFLQLIQAEYYNGLTFYRVVDDYMIQTGDPTESGTGGESATGEPLQDEFSPNLSCFRGAVVMANSGPNTATSQFYIVQRPFLPEGWEQALLNNGYPQEVVDQYIKVGGTPERNFKDTVFGQVIEGMDVVDAIAKTPVEYNELTRETTKPVLDVRIKSIKLEKYKTPSKNKEKEVPQESAASDSSSEESSSGGM